LAWLDEDYLFKRACILARDPDNWPQAQLDRLYDNAIIMAADYGMSFDRYWASTEREMERYYAAIQRVLSRSKNHG